MATKLIQPKANEKILDYGTGDGFMLRCLLSSCANISSIVGYEPVKSVFDELNEKLKQHIESREIVVIDDLKKLDGMVFNKISCLEVLEHLTKENQRKVVATLNKLLAKDGHVVVSVPIEIGPPSVAKNLIRILAKQPHDNTSIKNILKSFLGIRIARTDSLFISTHIGFYYKDIENIFASEGFDIAAKKYSPFGFFGALINSQVFYILKKNSTRTMNV
jgi:2-polyprenyl-3-methyl-5-hydroxy-6-metoxy-1,4-benzoquinol methylase